mgnify:CR=1 FL=1
MRNKIGIFDSGIGGLTTLEEIRKLLPNESYIYYADSKHNPYGEKSDEELYKIVKNIVNKLLEKKVKIIVIACNTATTRCIEKLRNDFDWSQLDGIGEEINSSIYNWKKDNFNQALRLSSYCFWSFQIDIGMKMQVVIDTLKGKTFCNRDELIKDIEEHGGKYVSSVTKKTDYLINNDTESMSSKNKKAKEFGCKIISEEDYNDMKLPF